jgi:hypothetical protein
MADALPVLGGQAGRRFCRSCTDRLPAALGADSRSVLVSRDDWSAAYAGLTIEDLMVAAAWCRTVDETHQVGRIALMLYGPKPLRHAVATVPKGARVLALHEAIEKRRDRLRNAELTDAERAAQVARREAETAERQRIQSARRSAAVLDKAMDRRARGGYLMPHERELLQSS